MKKKLNILIFAAVAIFGLSSCSDFLEEYSQDLAKVDSWRDLDELLLGDGYFAPSKIAVVNSYVDTDNGDNLDLLHFMSDEVKESTDNYNDFGNYLHSMFPFYTWQHDTGLNDELKYVGGDDVYWDMLYDKINITNMVIALIDEQAEYNEDDHAEKERVKGEAYFLRAAYYFLLVNLYAQPYTPATAATTPGVPVKRTEYVEDIEYERIPVETVYKYIIDDLEKAERCLEGKKRVSAYRANITATHLLQSRVHLYMQDWENAAKYARMVIDEQGSLLDLHTKNAGEDCVYLDSPETIFTMGGYLISTAFSDSRYDEPTYYLSDDMLELFTADDMRSSLYVGNTEYRNYPGVFMKVNGQHSKWGGYFEVSSCFLMRTPEAYLTLAEATAYMKDETACHQALKTFLKTRMNATADIDKHGNDLIDFIRDERAREFLLEGHRWFDLRRYTVCQPRPWSKVIEHGHIYYASYYPDYADFYRLEANDPAYTLPIPRKVRNFQISLGNNERPVRTPFYTENY